VAASGVVMIAGLGNPGPEYERTRHNVGFWTVDLLAEDHRLPLEKKSFEPGSPAARSREARRS